MAIGTHNSCISLTDIRATTAAARLLSQPSRRYGLLETTYDHSMPTGTCQNQWRVREVRISSVLRNPRMTSTMPYRCHLSSPKNRCRASQHHRESLHLLLLSHNMSTTTSPSP